VCYAAANVPIAKRREQGAVLRYFYAAYNNLPITNESVQLCAPESGNLKIKERGTVVLTVEGCGVRYEIDQKSSRGSKIIEVKTIFVLYFNIRYFPLLLVTIRFVAKFLFIK
jgi:hypothetical protein